MVESTTEIAGIKGLLYPWVREGPGKMERLCGKTKQGKSCDVESDLDSV